MNLAPVARLQPGGRQILGIYSSLDDFCYYLKLVRDQCCSAFSGQRNEDGNLSQEGRGNWRGEGCPVTWGPGGDSGEGVAKS